MTLASETELLTAYAAGETSPGLSLLCATQLSHDPRNREFVAMAEEVAGEALRLAPVGDVTMSLDSLLTRLDEAEHAPATRSEASAPSTMTFPTVLQEAIGCAEDEIPWRFRLPGISEHVLNGFDGERVSLMRARPGARVPQHTHRGVEATLVLAGAMKDDRRVLTKGDIALCGSDHDHHPEIIGEETCYCLIVVDGGLRFTGALGRALNLFSDGRGRN
ncbi:MAG: cupin domain-containing protein [Pseudomonadota bacterium]